MTPADKLLISRKLKHCSLSDNQRKEIMNAVNAIPETPTASIHERDTELRRLSCESVSARCKRLHVQLCDVCDDMACGDNKSLAKVEITRLNALLAKLDDILPVDMEDEKPLNVGKYTFTPDWPPDEAMRETVKERDDAVKEVDRLRARLAKAERVTMRRDT